MSYSLQQTVVSTVRDPTADMATNARKGSSLLRDVRERREQSKMRKRFWELGGSRIGDAMGLARPETTEVAPNEEGGENVDYKDGSSYAKHIKEKSGAASEFSKTKSLAEQRAFLPVYTVRQDLLDVVRENQVTVIVGETGSGMYRRLIKKFN